MLGVRSYVDIPVRRAPSSSMSLWAFLAIAAGARFGKPAEIAGGLVLVFMGTRILLHRLGIW